MILKIHQLPVKVIFIQTSVKVYFLIVPNSSVTGLRNFSLPFSNTIKVGNCFDDTEVSTLNLKERQKTSYTFKNAELEKMGDQCHQPEQRRIGWLT